MHEPWVTLICSKSYAQGHGTQWGTIELAWKSEKQNSKAAQKYVYFCDVETAATVPSGISIFLSVSYAVTLNFQCYI